MKEKEYIKTGYIWAPYIIKNHSFTLNNTIVWHNNRFINFLLKIKFLFFKHPLSKYRNKKVNFNYYSILKIEKL